MAQFLYDVLQAAVGGPYMIHWRSGPVRLLFREKEGGFTKTVIRYCLDTFSNIVLISKSDTSKSQTQIYNYLTVTGLYVQCTFKYAVFFTLFTSFTSNMDSRETPFSTAPTPQNSDQIALSIQDQVNTQEEDLDAIHAGAQRIHHHADNMNNEVINQNTMLNDIGNVRRSMYAYSLKKRILMKVLCRQQNVLRVNSRLKHKMQF